MPSAVPWRAISPNRVMARAIAALGLSWAIASTACRPQNDTTKAPANARVEDAAKLPTFDAPPSDDVTEPERFYVELGDAPARGPDDAAVTVVMFSDFECPFCLKGHETLERLLDDYPGKVRVVYKAFPLDMHPHAMLAAMAARSAQAQGNFWQFHDLLFSQNGIDPDRILDYARRSGLDLEQLARDVESLRFGPEVNRDLRQGRRLGVSSTPTFFINGRIVEGARAYDEFVDVVDDEIARSEQWIADGISPAQLYAHAIADGYRRVVYTEGRRLDPDGVFVVPVGESPTRGPANAPITIVAFEDFECPFCARGNATLEVLAKMYPGQIRTVFKHHPLPFHSHALIASRAALAAQAQGKFWAFHDELYDLHARFDEDDLIAVAKKSGLDMKRFVAHMNSTELDHQIETDLELAMMLGVTGTPAYFVNGRPIEGARPPLHFRLIIEEELQRAADARKRGVEPGELYHELTHEQLE